MRNALIACTRAFIFPVLLAALSVVGFAGCDEKKVGLVEDTAKHGEASTKNMKNFMDNKAAQPKEKTAPKVQTK
jgi:hypothetical protein